MRRRRRRRNKSSRLLIVDTAHSILIIASINTIADAIDEDREEITVLK